MIALAVLVALLFSKQLYVSSLSSYYIFYLIDRFGVSTQAAQFYLFIFLAANAVGAFFGGPLGDRFGRKYVIWFSILGALPFTLALPYAGLFGSAVLTVFIGLILSSATSSIIVFAQELMPHRFGMISGVFFGVAFGIGGLGAAVLGKLADHTGIAFVYQVCAFLPAIGLLAVFLPKMPKPRALTHGTLLSERGDLAADFVNTLLRLRGRAAIQLLLQMHRAATRARKIVRDYQP